MKITAQYCHITTQRDDPFQLTASTLQNLHLLVSYIQHSDYQSALMLHTQMVQGYDFAEISPFMPSLKALLQSGGQLGVRYQ